MKKARPANHREVLPSGAELEYWDNIGVDGLPQRRRYKVDGVACVGVSTIAGMMPKDLTGWAWRLGVSAAISYNNHEPLPTKHEYDDIQPIRSHAEHLKLTTTSARDTAAERGTLAHEEAERLMKQIMEEPYINVRTEAKDGYCQAAEQFLNEYVHKVEFTELTVASPRLGVAGRLDGIVETKQPGKTGNEYQRTIVDFKTTTIDNPTIYTSHIAQLSGYSILAEESGYGKIENAMIVKLLPTGKFHACSFRVEREIFEACLKMYEAERKAKRIAKRSANPPDRDTKAP